MLNAGQFRELIVKSTLIDLVSYSESAEELLVFTCAVESFGGSYLQQINGSGLGVYQMSPVTYNELWQTYIKDRTSLCLILLSNFDAGFIPTEERLIYDLRFATAMAYIKYKRIKEPLPLWKDQEALWKYYKTYYNTSKKDSDKESSLEMYHAFIGR